MKNLVTILAASAALTGSIFAGQPVVDHKVISTPAIEHFGTGWYGAIQGGVNAHQDLGGDKSRRDIRGNKITLKPAGDGVGGFGGLKLGYVFGTGFVRPALEADLFYNGLDSQVDVNVNGKKVGSVNGRIDSGAFMANSLLRFNFERFQPYFGFGLGYWVAQGNDTTIKIKNSSSSSFSTQSKDGLAWQVIAGGDYYFTPKCSAFLEYKFLNYADAVLDNPAQQQLIGAGVRFHF
jgi:opacity protein-like surface antigen